MIFAYRDYGRNKGQRCLRGRASRLRGRRRQSPRLRHRKSQRRSRQEVRLLLFDFHMFFFPNFFSVWLRWNFGRVDIFSWNDMVFAYIYIYAIKRGKKFNSEPYSCFRLSWGRSTFSWVAMVKNVASILVSGIYQHFVGNQTEDFEFHLNSDFVPFGCGKFRGKSLN